MKHSVNMACINSRNAINWNGNDDTKIKGKTWYHIIVPEPSTSSGPSALRQTCPQPTHQHSSLPRQHY